MWKKFRSRECLGCLDASLTSLRKLLVHHPELFRGKPDRVQRVLPVMLESLMRGPSAVAVNGLRCVVEMFRWVLCVFWFFA